MASTDYRSEEEMLRIVRERADALARARRARRRRGAGALAAVVLVGTTVTIARWPDDEASVGTVGVAHEEADGEAWLPMAASPLSGRSSPVTVWTGDELLVWRGDGASSDVCQATPDGTICGEPMRNDGGAYDPETDTWRLLPDGPMPAEDSSSFRGPVAGVWTGRALVVWGGIDVAAGAAYDPATDRWRSIASAPLDRRIAFTMTWTGSEVVVLGGQDAVSGAILDGGAAYDPVADRWRIIAPSGVGRAGHSALWVDDRLLVVGGFVHGAQRSTPVTAVQRYDPAADVWTTVATAPMDQINAAVAMDDEVMAIGSTGSGLDVSPAAATYDPVQDRCARVPEPPMREGTQPYKGGLLVDTSQPAVAWTGHEVIVMRDIEGRTAGRDVAYDPSTGSWRVIPRSWFPSRAKPAVAWTGDELLVWGGAQFGGFSSTVYGDGARYRPGR